MEKQPKYNKGDKVTGAGLTGKIEKVWTVNPNMFRYTIKTADGKILLNENEISRA